MKISTISDDILLYRPRYSTRAHALGWIGIWLALVITSWYCRPLLPVNETRITGVAWEMWLHSSGWVPLLNGEPYDAPPLLFWAIQLLWKITGVSLNAARMVGALFSLGILFLSSWLCHQLWPEDRRARCYVPLILIGTLFWCIFSTALIPELASSFFVLLAMNMLWLAWRKKSYGWAIPYTIAATLALFSVGWIALAYLLPVNIGFYYWCDISDRQIVKRWLTLATLVHLLAMLIFLAWKLHVLIQINAVQSSNQSLLTLLRYSVDPFAEAQPLWWYLVYVPLVLFPWVIWPPLWRAAKTVERDSAFKFCLIWVCGGFFCFVLFGRGSVNSLLPLLPAGAALVARCAPSTAISRREAMPVGFSLMIVGLLLTAIPLISKYIPYPAWVGYVSPLWGAGLAIFGIALLWQFQTTRVQAIALMSVAITLALNLGIVRQSSDYYNIAAVSGRISFYQKAQIPLANSGRYHDQFHFMGKLTQPIPAFLQEKPLKAWLQANPGGRLILYPDELLAKDLELAHEWQPYRGRYIVIHRVENILKYPDELLFEIVDGEQQLR